MLPEFFKFSVPTRAIYGAGLVENVAEHLQEFAGKTALIVTDKIITKAGLLAKLLKGLEGSTIKVGAIFDDVPPNSELRTVTKAAQVGKENKCDLIIALGGGSVLDTAKVVNVLMFKGGELKDHLGAQLINEKIYPSIFIPTTAGTGSEATEFAMISDSANNVKLPFAEYRFLPDIAVLDPQMTETMPGKVTAATGMDALTHAIESFVSIDCSPVTEALSLYAIEIIAANLRQACAVPEDLEARGAMLVASYIAALAFNHAGVGMVHGISHGLGGVYHIPHGVANSIILPFSIEHNQESSASKYARISEAMGEFNILPVNEISRQVSRLNISMLNEAVNQLSFVDEWVQQQKARGLADKLRMMNQQLKALTGHATSLREAGISDGFKNIEGVVEASMQDGAMLYNPQSVDADSVRDILQRAYQQDLPAIEVSRGELKANRSRVAKTKLKGIYKDTDNLYEILIGFFESMRNDAEINSSLTDSKLKVRFNYSDPDAFIALDCSSSPIKVLSGKEAQDLDVDIELSLKADLAHYFWHGEVNAVQALARREVIPKGNLPKAMKLLPILEPAYIMYPKYLREIGLGKLVVA